MTCEEETTRFALAQAHGQRGEIPENHVSKELFRTEAEHVARLINARHLS